jgi:Epoxide hydrolase N terminus
MTMQVEAFKLTVPDTDIADLRERLRRTRFPDQAPAPPWAYGTDVAWMPGLIDYWREKFDWRAQEARLNAFPQYKVHLQDIDLHFLQVEGQRPFAGASDSRCAVTFSRDGFHAMSFVGRLERADGDESKPKWTRKSSHRGTRG